MDMLTRAMVKENPEIARMAEDITKLAAERGMSYQDLMFAVGIIEKDNEAKMLRRIITAESFQCKG